MKIGQDVTVWVAVFTYLPAPCSALTVLQDMTLCKFPHVTNGHFASVVIVYWSHDGGKVCSPRVLEQGGPLVTVRKFDDNGLLTDDAMVGVAGVVLSVDSCISIVTLVESAIPVIGECG